MSFLGEERGPRILIHEEWIGPRDLLESALSGPRGRADVLRSIKERLRYIEKELGGCKRSSEEEWDLFREGVAIKSLIYRITSSVPHHDSEDEKRDIKRWVDYTKRVGR